MPDSAVFRERHRLSCLTSALVLGAATSALAQNGPVAPTPAQAPVQPPIRLPLPLQGRVPLMMNGTPRLPAGQPQFPDRASAEAAISKIKTLQDAMPLYYPLFQMRNARGIRPEYVMLILEKQVAAEKPESERWALLQILRGYGGFVVRGFNCDANDAYLALFTSAAPPSPRLMTHALNNYFNSVSGGLYGNITTRPFGRAQLASSFININAPDTGTSLEVLHAALRAYLALPAEMNATDFRVAAAAANTEATDEILTEVETRLAATPVEDASRLRLLRMALPFYEDKDPEKALQTAGEVETLMAKLNWYDSQSHDRYLGLLTAGKRLDQAATVQAAWVKRCGQGQGKLMELWLQCGHATEAQNLLQDVKRPETKSNVQFEVIGILNKAWTVPGFDHRRAVRELAQAFLDSRLPRNPDQEITVRLILARHLYASHEAESAVQVLDGMRLPQTRNLNYLGSQISLLSETRQRMAEGTFCDA